MTKLIWHSGGSLHLRGMDLKDWMVPDLLDLWAIEADAAHAAGNWLIGGRIEQLIAELLVARAEQATWQRAARAA